MVLLVPEDFFTVCGRTLTYHVEEFSEDFDISEEDFLGAIKSAESMWEDATGYDLFAYSPKGKLSINLVYSPQQEKSEQWKTTERTLANINEEIRLSDEQYTSLSAKYEVQLSKYESDLMRFNQQVQYWNEQ